jgi:hypothetical protein
MTDYLNLAYIKPTESGIIFTFPNYNFNPQRLLYLELQLSFQNKLDFYNWRYDG